MRVRGILFPFIVMVYKKHVEARTGGVTQPHRRVRLGGVEGGGG